MKYENGYGSHKPVLEAALNYYGSPTVLELGMGHNSSKIISDKASHAEHFETKESWIQKVESFLNPDISTTHFVEAIEDIDFNKRFKGKRFDIIFIDFAPGEPRGEMCKRLAKKGEMLICHDTEETIEPEAASDYRWDFSGFKYKFHFMKARPHTTVVSNFIDVSKIFSNL